MNVIIKKSNKSDKEFMAIIDNKKTLHFGANMYEDYTHHKDTERKKLIYQGIKKTILII